MLSHLWLPFILEMTSGLEKWVAVIPVESSNLLATQDLKQYCFTSVLIVEFLDYVFLLQILSSNSLIITAITSFFFFQKWLP